jgi:hypothetical protein
MVVERTIRMIESHSGLSRADFLRVRPLAFRAARGAFSFLLEARIVGSDAPAHQVPFDFCTAAHVSKGPRSVCGLDLQLPVEILAASSGVERLADSPRRKRRVRID